MFSGQNPAACGVLRMKNTVWTQCWVGDGAKGTVQWLIRRAREPTLTTALLPPLPPDPAYPRAVHTARIPPQYTQASTRPVPATFNCIMQPLVHIPAKFVPIYLHSRPCLTLNCMLYGGLHFSQGRLFHARWGQVHFNS